MAGRCGIQDSCEMSWQLKVLDYFLEGCDAYGVLESIVVPCLVFLCNHHSVSVVNRIS